jgi:hypothetical protein
MGRDVFGLKFSTSRRKIVQTKHRDTLVPSTLNAVTSEQIDAYIRFCAKARKHEIEAEEAAQQVAKGAKKPKVQKRRHYVTDDAGIVALAQSVGDRRVKKAGVIETKRPY